MATIEHSTLSGSELHDPKAHTHDTLYLKRAAADISTFTEKVSPASADLVIIEDSAASYAKKKVQVGNLPGGGGGVTDHGALTGLGDDDHTQYFLVNGARGMSGTLMMGDYWITGITQLTPSGTTITIAGILDVNSHKITSLTDPTSAQDAATKVYWFNPPWSSRHRRPPGTL